MTEVTEGVIEINGDHAALLVPNVKGSAIPSGDSHSSLEQLCS